MVPEGDTGAGGGGIIGTDQSGLLSGPSGAGGLRIEIVYCKEKKRVMSP